jgi:glucose dehydrogenase
MADLDPEKLAVAVGTAVAKALTASHPPKAEIPAPLKLAAGVLTALATASVIGMGMWLVSTVADVQGKVTEMAAVAQVQSQLLDERDKEVRRRLESIEKGQS